MSRLVLPTLLLLGLLVGAARSAPPPPEPLVFEGRPAREVLPALGEQLKVVLKADPALAEVKLSLRIAEADLKSVQSALAVAVDGAWKTRGREGQPEYWLCPSDERDRRLSRYRQERVDRLQRQTEGLKRSILVQDVPDNPSASRGSLGAFLPQAYDILRTLPEGCLDRALAHPNPPFNGSEGAKVPGIAVPVAALPLQGREATSQLLRYLGDRMDEGRPGAGSTYRRQAADPSGMKVELWTSSAPSTGGAATLHLSLRTADGKRAADVTLARTISLPKPSTSTPPVTGTPGSNGSSPPMDSATHEPREQRSIKVPEGRYRHDHLLAAVAKAANLETVSDYYTKGTVTTISPGPKRLEDLLRGFDRIYRCRHFWVGDILVFRSENWEALSEAEPPAVVTDRLTQAGKDPKTLEIDDLVFAAQNANDERLATLEYHTDPSGKALPLNLVPRLRMNAAWLRAYGALGAAKSLPVPKNGLYLARLPRTARAAWQDVFLQAGVLSERDMAAARLRRTPGSAFQDWPAVNRFTLELGGSAPPLDLWRTAISY